MVKTIRIFGRERKDNDGKKFVVYSYTKDGKTFYQLKFRKECTMLPKETGYWLIEVDTNDCQVQRMKANKDFKPNDILWIKNITSVKRDSAYEEVIRAAREQEIEDLF